MIKLIGQYDNGNYSVKIFEDGTKIRENDLDFFESSFPENIDIKITNRCDMGCKMCHEKSTKNGKNAKTLFPKFIETLRPYTELAIGGGNIFEHPELLMFLHKLREKKIIANITINQVHFEENFSLVRKLISQKLVHGVGVSLTHPSDKFISMFKSCGDNMVLHVINGIVTKYQIDKYLAGKGIKILLLGYKTFGRGIEFKDKNSESIKENQNYISENLDKLFRLFKVVSFDNLAIEQINVRKWLTKEQYDLFYMGNEGNFTMYIDLVEEKFAQNSTSNIRHPIMSTIDDMFSIVKKESK